MYSYKLILITFTLTACVGTSSFENKPLSHNILEIAEEYLSKDHQHSDPYIVIMNDLKQIKSRQEYLQYFCRYTPLLSNIFRITNLEYKNTSDYYIETRVSNEGILYITYNIAENSFLSDLKKSSDDEIRDYVQNIMTSGDVSPSLIAGTSKWDISASSAPEKRLLFILHLIIISNKCANSQ